MASRNILCLSCLLLLAFAPVAASQGPESFPPVYKSKQPPTPEELNQRASLHQYLFGVLCERDDRLLEALKAYEKAAELDPKAPATFKAQVAILIILDRPGDALDRAEKTLALDPDDFKLAFVLARLHQSQGSFKEALRALEKAAAQPSLKDFPALAQQIYFDLGGLYESTEAFAKAAAAFGRAADILDHPELLLMEGPFHRPLIQSKAAETYERIGHLHRKAKEFDQASAAFKKAQTRLPERAGRLNWNLAQVAHEQGQADQALAYLDEYLRLQPLAPEPYHLKIDLLTKLKRPGEILPWMEKTVQADPHNSGLKLLLAREFQKAGQTAQAEKTFKQLAEDAPSPEVYRGLFKVIHEDPSRGMVQVLFQLNKALAEAAKKPPLPNDVARAKAMIGALRDDVALAKDLVDVAFRLGKGDEDLELDTLHLLAGLADKHRKTDEAERFYRTCLKVTPVGLEHLVYGGLLRTLWKGRKYEAIIEVCKEGLGKAKATNRLLFHNDLARAHARLGRFKEALAAVDQAIDLAGDQHVLTIKLTRVRILIQAEQFDQAEKECAAMLKEFHQPGDVLEVRSLLSHVFSAWKKMARAEEQLELVLKMGPANATANNDLGYLWADQGKHLEKAEELIRRAIDLDRRQRKLSREVAEEDQDNAAYIDSLGWVLFRRGQMEEARKELERAVKLPGGEDPTLWDHLGDVYYRLERYPDARRAWETSRELFEKEERRKGDERYHEVQKKLKSLEKVTGMK